jgi:hypothetical protein
MGSSKRADERAVRRKVRLKPSVTSGITLLWGKMTKKG